MWMGTRVVTGEGSHRRGMSFEIPQFFKKETRMSSLQRGLRVGGLLLLAGLTVFSLVVCWGDPGNRLLTTSEMRYVAKGAVPTYTCDRSILSAPCTDPNRTCWMYTELYCGT